MLLEVEFIHDFNRIILSLWSFSLQILHVLKVLFKFDWALCRCLVGEKIQVAMFISRDLLHIV
jgi:hypothetical protein